MQPFAILCLSLHQFTRMQAAKSLEHALQLEHQNADARALLGNALFDSDPGLSSA